MRTELKGTIALGAAAAVLIGAGGTLAFWRDALEVPGVSPSSGELKLLTETCGDWLLDGGATYTTQLLVPGDTLTRTCTAELQATGAHLEADITVGGGAATGLLATHLEVDADYTVDGVGGVTTVTSDDDGETIEAVVTVTFPYGTLDNTSQDLSAVLSDFVVTLTQAPH